MSLDNVRTKFYQLGTRAASLQPSMITRTADNLKPGPASLFRGAGIPLMQMTMGDVWVHKSLSGFQRQTEAEPSPNRGEWSHFSKVFFFFNIWRSSAIYSIAIGLGWSCVYFWSLQNGSEDSNVPNSPTDLKRWRNGIFFVLGKFLV